MVPALCLNSLTNVSILAMLGLEKLLEGQVLASTGLLVQDCMLQPPRYFWQIYELFNIHDAKLDGVSFSAMAQQFPKVIGLFVVVAFGSSLDVAAIQADSPEPLDYNHELKTVGALPISFHQMICSVFDLSAMAQQFLKVIGLFVLVAFGSSLDVAAIQGDSI